MIQKYITFIVKTEDGRLFNKKVRFINGEGITCNSLTEDTVVQTEDEFTAAMAVYEASEQNRTVNAPRGHEFILTDEIQKVEPLRALYTVDPTKSNTEA